MPRDFDTIEVPFPERGEPHLVKARTGAGPVDGVALALVLAAAGAHAAWNLLAKQARAALAVVCALRRRRRPSCGHRRRSRDGLSRAASTLAGVAFMAGSALLHIGYYVTLQRAYASATCRVVYPLARGTGPLLRVAAAILSSASARRRSGCSAAR